MNAFELLRDDFKDGAVFVDLVKQVHKYGIDQGQASHVYRILVIDPKEVITEDKRGNVCKTIS